MCFHFPGANSLAAFCVVFVGCIATGVTLEFNTAPMVAVAKGVVWVTDAKDGPPGGSDQGPTISLRSAGSEMVSKNLPAVVLERRLVIWQRNHLHSRKLLGA